MFIRKLMMVLAFLPVLNACTSGAELDDLQRRTQLLSMEVDNVKHERGELQQSLKQVRADLAASEQRYADLKAADNETQRTASDAQAQVAQAEARVAALKAQLQEIRALIASGRIDNAEDRQALIVQLAAPAGQKAPAPELPRVFPAQTKVPSAGAAEGSVAH